MSINQTKGAFVTLPGNDAGPFQASQCSSLGTTSNFNVVYPYGFGGNPPINSPILLHEILGQESNLAGIAMGGQIRLKNTKPGEVYMSNRLTETRMLMDEEGNLNVIVNGNKTVTIEKDNTITINGSKNVTIKGSETVTIEGDSTINVTGNAILSAASVTIDGNTTINGNLIVKGTISATQDITALTASSSLDFSSIRSNYNAHTHISATAGNPSSSTDSPI